MPAPTQQARTMPHKETHCASLRRQCCIPSTTCKGGSSGSNRSSAAQPQPHGSDSASGRCSRCAYGDDSSSRPQQQPRVAGPLPHAAPPSITPSDP